MFGIHRHKPTRKLYTCHHKHHGKTRIVVVGARRCKTCGAWLPPFDSRIVNKR